MDGYDAEAFFFPGLAGRLFALHYKPITPDHTKSSVLLVPPFAEEMNKSRRTFSLLAQSLASRGVSVLLLDLFACGDSEGDFSQARWDIWRQDICSAAQWLRDGGAGQVHALGLRTGALLALDAHGNGCSPFDRLIFWAPVINGQLTMTHFLRLRLAASLVGGGDNKETTKSLTSLLRNGESVEIAGYRLSPELFSAINDLKMSTFPSASLPEIDWFELVSETGRSPSPMSQRIIDAWQQNGAQVNVSSVVAEPFWSTLEISEASNLIDKTLDSVGRQ